MSVSPLLTGDAVPAIENSAPVLFLDFDGVPHKLGEPAFDEDWRLIDNPNLLCRRHYLEDALAPHPAVGIILSSDWRRLCNDELLASLLGPAFGLRMIGAVEMPNSSRAEDIRGEAARRGISNWLALDDHPSVADAYRVGDKRFIV